jgi:hypothetical protein
MFFSYENINEANGLFQAVTMMVTVKINPKTEKFVCFLGNDNETQILDLVCENVLLNIDGITEKSNGQIYYVVEGNHYTETEVKIDKQSILDTLKEIE